jgi:hypothetical protein
MVVLVMITQVVAAELQAAIAHKMSAFDFEKSARSVIARGVVFVWAHIRSRRLASKPRVCCGFLLARFVGLAPRVNSVIYVPACLVHKHSAPNFLSLLESGSTQKCSVLSLGLVTVNVRKFTWHTLQLQIRKALDVFLTGKKLEDTTPKMVGC